MPKTLAYLLGKGGQDMPLTLRETQSVIRELAARYECASRNERSQLIVQLAELTGYVRSYAARVLRKPLRPGRPRRPHGKRGLVYAHRLSGR